MIDTVSFEFTTQGAPTSMVLTPAAQTVAVGGTAAMAVELKDANGALTQPLCADSVTTAASPSTAGSPQAVTTCTNSAATSLFDGKAVFTYSPSAAGTYAISATPGGTLPAGGVSTQTVSVTADTVIVPATTIVSAPAAGVSQGDNSIYTEPTSVTAANPSASTDLYVATSVKDISIKVTGATAGAKIAYSVTDSESLPAGVTDMASTVTLDANKAATITVSASAPFATSPTVGSEYTLVIGVSGGVQSTYDVKYRTTNTVNVGNITLSPKATTTSYVKTGEATSVSATVTNQFGLPLPGVVVASTPSASTGVTGTTGSDGIATLAVAAPTNSSVTTQTVSFKGTFGGTTTSATGNVTFIYNSTGGPTSLSVASNIGDKATTAELTQNVDTAGNVTGTYAVTDATTKTRWMQLTATVGGSVTGVPVTFTGDGLYFTGNNADSLNSADTKAGTFTVTSTGGSAVAFVKATKTGTATVNVAAGTLTDTISWKVANQATDARVLKVEPAEQAAADRATVVATVTDAFGNAVGGVSLTFSEVGAGIFANGASTLVAATGPTGVVSVENLATGSGESVVTVTGVWTGSANSPITGAPAAVTSGVAKVTFSPSGTKSITIAGSRTTVRGKPGIQIDGITTGIEDGKTVIPYFRFPGQTDYTQGSARPVVNDEEFTWQRKTGKKFYAYVTNDDGAVKSNRVIIAAK